MRKMAPLMYCWGLLMVVVQIMAAIAMLLNTIYASCGSNEQCSSFVSYCQVLPGNRGGRCLPCGQAAPLVPYWSDEPYGADFGFKVYNEVSTGAYPNEGFMKRSRIASGFAGYNLTHVMDRCTPPYRTFQWEATGACPDGSDECESSDKVMTIVDGTDIPYGITPYGSGKQSWTAASVERWCQNCVLFAGAADITQESVSMSNHKLQADSTVDAMSPLDWFALFLCVYIVGLTLAGEVKDMALVEIATEKSLLELSTPWRIALSALGALRAHFFIQPLFSIVPAVVVAKGGGALDVCFNTVAVLCACCYCLPGALFVAFVRITFHARGQHVET